MKPNKPAIGTRFAAGVTSEEARDIRARALRYAFDRYLEKQKAANTGDDEDGKPKPPPVVREDA